MSHAFSWFIGLRYAGIKTEARLLAFLARMAMSGLIFGTALLVVVLSVMNGFDRELRERILNIVPHITLYHDTRGMREHPEAIDWKGLEQTISRNPQVSEVIPFIEVEGLLKTADQAEPLLFYGVEDYPALGDYIAASEITDWKQNETGLLVGAHLAEKMHLHVGDEVIGLLSVASSGDGDALSRMLPQRFQVAGIFDTKTELDKSLIVAHRTLLQTVTGADGPQGYRLRVKDLFRAPVIEWQLLQQMPASFYGRNWSQTHGNLYEAVQMSRALVSLLMFVIIAVAVFNIVSTLILVVIEKKQAIAILRVQGASRCHIIQLFMVQGTIIGCMGSCIGALLGVIVSLLLPDVVAGLEHAFHFQFLRTDVYPISYIPSDVRMGQVLSVVAVATVFSFVTSLYPAWRATRVEPADVLRYE